MEKFMEGIKLKEFKQNSVYNVQVWKFQNYITTGPTKKNWKDCKNLAGCQIEVNDRRECQIKGCPKFECRVYYELPEKCKHIISI